MKTRSIAAVAVLALAGAAQATIVYSNNPPAGDVFTNSGTSNTGQAIGASGWYYNNVRNFGIAGVNTYLPRSGNGSVLFNGSVGPGGASSKADVELLVNAVPNGNGNFGTTGALGRLRDLSSLSYEWYRESTSGATNHLHPVLRLQIVNQAGTQFGYIIFERIYNGFGVAPTDTWTADDLYANRTTYNMWSTGTLPGAFTNFTTTLDTWMTSSENYFVVGVSSGIGSGWGTFTGAVDNIGVGFNGVDDVYNFEVIPTPGAAALLGLGGLAAARRRRA